MCTDFFLPFDESHSVRISGRTMDFTHSQKVNFTTDLVKVPLGTFFQSKAPSQGSIVDGLSWHNQYGFVGAWMYESKKDSTGPSIVPNKMSFCDGMNTEGLSAAVLWLSYSEYEQPTHPQNCLEMDLIVSYVLGTCSTVEETISRLKGLTVWFPDQWQTSVANHLCIHDRQGESLVVEFVGGEKKIYRNSIGVLANEPTFDIQSINYLSHFNALTPEDNNIDYYAQFKKGADGCFLLSKGSGYQYEILSSGMRGLPGDSSSSSRFYRAAKLINSCLPKQYSSQHGVQYALQVIGRLAVCEQEVLTLFDSDGNQEDPRLTYNPTLWQVVRDHSEKKIYLSTRLNHNLQAISLGSLDFSKGADFSTMSIELDEWCLDQSHLLEK